MRVKRKLFLTTAFAALLSVGVFVGVSSSKESKPAEAVAVGEKVYCKMQYSWWTDSSAAIGAYFFNAQSKTAAVSWPGTRMTQESSIDSYTWSINRPSGNYDTVIFVRVNGSGNIADWGAQTNDLTIPTDTKNFYTISSSTAQWSGDGKKVSGSWSNYHSVDPSSTNNQFYVYDPKSKLGSTFANINVYGFGEGVTIKSMDWPGTHSGITQTTLGGRSVYSVSLSSSYPSFIMNNNSVQTVDCSISGNTGKVLVIEEEKDGSDHYYTHWTASSDFTNDCPASDGYYILGSKTSFLFANAPKMSDYTTGGNIARYLGYSASAGESIKVKSCFLDANPTRTWSAYNGGETPFGAADNDGNFVFAKAATVDIYAKWESSYLKFYIDSNNAYDGYYMVGDNAFISEFGTSGGEYKFVSGVKMNAGTGTNVAVYTFTNETTITFKARKYLDSGDDWAALEINSTATTHGASITDGNYVVPAGTYSLYVFYDNTTLKSSLTWGMPLDSYTAEFMSLTGPACAASDVSALASAWSTLSTDWAKLSTDDQNTLKSTVASETGTDAQKVMARYDVIIHNHSSFGDYMGRKSNANYTYKSIIRVLDSIQNSGATIAIIAISVASLAAVGGYFLFRKKKEN